MNSTSFEPARILVLGPSTGWHADQLVDAAQTHGLNIDFANYESLRASVSPQSQSGNSSQNVSCVHCTTSRREAQPFETDVDLTEYDAILVRTMPAASLEKITFRLACLHATHDGLLGKSIPVINSPRGLEWSIDKYATLSRLSAAGYATPNTRFCQSRAEAMIAFKELGGDCVVKPLLGGEGRGVMHVSDEQLAWTTFSTLERLDAVLQIQQFIRPGGKDRRFLVVGDQVFGVRRDNPNSFRSNVSAGGYSTSMELDGTMADHARRIVKLLGLEIASVDQIENESGPPLYLEVNAIPGWKGAQRVIATSIAEQMIQAVVSKIYAEKVPDSIGNVTEG